MSVTPAWYGQDEQLLSKRLADQCSNQEDGDNCACGFDLVGCHVSEIGESGSGAWEHARPRRLTKPRLMIGLPFLALLMALFVLLPSRQADPIHQTLAGGRPTSTKFGGDLDQEFAVLPTTVHNGTERPFQIVAQGSPKLCVESDAIGCTVTMKPCNNTTPNQQWLWSNETGLIRSRWHPKCLAHNGKDVTLQRCDASGNLLNWIVDEGSRSIRSHADECMDHGGSLHMQSCDNSAEQSMMLVKMPYSVIESELMRWPSGPVHIRHGRGGWCLQYSEDFQVTSAACQKYAPNQQWVYFPDTKTIMTYWHHRCLEAEVSNGEAGHTMLAMCQAGEARQQWWVTHHGKHLSVFGLCLHSGRGILRKCVHAGEEDWHIFPLHDWPAHGGVEPVRKQHPFFRAEDVDLPPEQSHMRKVCHFGSKLFGHCGAEHLRHPKGLPSRLWERLRYEIWKITWPYKVVVHVGDHRGLLFRYGKKYQNKPVEIASELKPITAVLAMRLVELGILGLDDKVNRWLPWWPTSPSDSRSYITLRHCLAFTSGFYGIENTRLDGFPNELSLPQPETIAWHEKFCKDIGAIECAQLVLNKTEHISPPGTVWTYTGDHLRIAAAMMTAATHKPFGELMHEHVFNRTAPPMTHTRKYRRYKFWNPASHAISTARDYQRFLDSYFRGLLVSSASSQEIEKDSQQHTRLRYFKGTTGEGRPKDHGLFGLGWWRSRSLTTLCGVYQWCAFAPSHYASVAVVERIWPVYLGKKKCPWKRSDTCSFYFHFQNVNLLDSYRAKTRFRSLSHVIESHAHRILSGGRQLPESWTD